MRRKRKATSRSLAFNLWSDVFFHPPTSLFLPCFSLSHHNYTLILLSPSPSLSNAPSLRPSPSLAHVSLSPVSLTPAKDPVTGFGGIRKVCSQHDGGFAPARFCSDDTDGLAPALSQQLLSTGNALSPLFIFCIVYNKYLKRPPWTAPPAWISWLIPQISSLKPWSQEGQKLPQQAWIATCYGSTKKLHKPHEKK